MFIVNLAFSDFGMMLTQVSPQSFFFFNYFGGGFEFIVQHPLIVIYRRGYFVYHNLGCASIYRPLHCLIPLDHWIFILFKDGKGGRRFGHMIIHNRYINLPTP